MFTWSFVLCQYPNEWKIEIVNWIKFWERRNQGDNMMRSLFLSMINFIWLVGISPCVWVDVSFYILLIIDCSLVRPTENPSLIGFSGQMRLLFIWNWKSLEPGVQSHIYQIHSASFVEGNFRRGTRVFVSWSCVCSLHEVWELPQAALLLLGRLNIFKCGC